MKINFFNEDIAFKPLHPKVLRSWIQSVISQHQFTLRNLNYIFCSDNHIHSVNLEYLRHDTYTDIITFDHSEDEGIIESDIYISIDRVRENAKKLSVSFEQELHRVMIHGVLHLCGHSDKGSAEKEAMRKKEDACLSLLPL